MSVSSMRVDHHADVYVAQQLTRRGAQATGFSPTACAELMIVASELASNILKYGRRGTLEIESIHHPQRGPGLRLRATDEGPPFKNFETALRDGFNDDGPVDPAALIARRGTASGLGAVQRLTDELTWEALEVGKAVIAVRYVIALGRATPIKKI
jgi:anti-sigma regulatory factor (Ser/Thr protein kinase)